MASLRRELAAGLRRTAPYLLSHHDADERDRCHALRVRGRTVRLCARCAGIYPGIALGLWIAGGSRWAAPLSLIAVLPAFALVDWAASAFAGADGGNAVRTATGALLGLGYAFGAVRLLRDPPAPGVLAVGVAYALVAATLLTVERRVLPER
ncbi:DUF2085 domain-containing protein [Halostella sp. JP-L12]|uniref:DUF2085 domain-containing protein n=1 Tax=Halostella TaxID=1843185 RepID=UPI000EF786B7|nr:MULTISPECIES: DUF2085 domain-containing protein [Halostella]NHN48583.1 DUF2085 domain-containing protein [Halostella sp. JP-L12]